MELLVAAIKVLLTLLAKFHDLPNKDSKLKLRSRPSGPKPRETFLDQHMPAGIWIHAVRVGRPNQRVPPLGGGV